MSGKICRKCFSLSLYKDSRDLLWHRLAPAADDPFSHYCSGVSRTGRYSLQKSKVGAPSHLLRQQQVWGVVILMPKLWLLNCYSLLKMLVFQWRKVTYLLPNFKELENFWTSPLLRRFRLSFSVTSHHVENITFIFIFFFYWIFCSWVNICLARTQFQKAWSLDFD